MYTMTKLQPVPQSKYKCRHDEKPHFAARKAEIISSAPPLLLNQLFSESYRGYNRMALVRSLETRKTIAALLDPASGIPFDVHFEIEDDAGNIRAR